MYLYKKLSHLPLLNFTETLFPKEHLKNVKLIACQHILPSTHFMLRSMINLGLDPKDIAVIGKCYSTNDLVMKNMIQEQIYVCPSSNQFNSDLSFDEQFIISVKNFLHRQLERMSLNKDDTLIILDDGGELISAAQTFKSYFPNIYGVEQTSSGYHKLAYTQMSFPVKNVAFSKAKLNFETPYIAKSVINNLEKKISLSKQEPKQILVVGYGCVGKEIKKGIQNNTLYEKHSVFAYDVIQEKTDIEYLDFSKFDIIIGATGNKMMTHNYYDLLKPNAILVSVSSSDREFDSVHLRKLSKKKYKTHDDVKYNSLNLLNCGFPINFSGEDIVSVPLEKIQLICALLMLGICELANGNIQQKHFVQLDENLTNLIIDKFLLENDIENYEK